MFLRMATGLSGKNGPVLRMRYMVIFREIWELSNRGCDFFLKGILRIGSEFAKKVPANAVQDY